MAQTFDIRFDAGGNSFGWKGGGRLRIDGQGLDFALKRGIASLLARQRSRRIPAEKIRDVYREGEALRIEFATDENPRVTLPFRARDRDTAAQIVQLLPTSRTIELEQTDAAPHQRVPQLPWVPGAVLLAAVVLFILLRPAPEVAGPGNAPAVPAVAVIEAPPLPATVNPAPAATPSDAAASVATVPRGDAITPDEARKLAMLAEDPVDWTQPPPRSRPSSVSEAAERRARLERRVASLPAADPPLPEAERDVEPFVPMEVPDVEVHPTQAVVRIPPTTLAYGVARGMLNAFEADAAALTASFRAERQRFDREALDARAFANRLDALEMRWRAVSERIVGTRKYEDAALAGLRAALLNVVIQQRLFLAGYAAGLRTDDQAGIERAFGDLARAEESMERARAFVN